MVLPVSAVTGHEPGHWHDVQGNHRMTDPRTIDGWPERWWDTDEKSYVTHLQTHEGERTDPRQRADDSPLVRSLFELMESKRHEIQSIKELIAARREAEEFLKS